MTKSAVAIFLYEYDNYARCCVGCYQCSYSYNKKLRYAVRRHALCSFELTPHSLNPFKPSGVKWL